MLLYLENTRPDIQFAVNQHIDKIFGHIITGDLHHIGRTLMGIDEGVHCRAVEIVLDRPEAQGLERLQVGDLEILGLFALADHQGGARHA